jgi:hypothetical protein
VKPIAEINAETMAARSTEITAMDVRAAIETDPELKVRYAKVIHDLAEFRVESLETELKQAGY